MTASLLMSNVLDQFGLIGFKTTANRPAISSPRERDAIALNSAVRNSANLIAEKAATQGLIVTRVVAVNNAVFAGFRFARR